jgi:NAD(P)-dependent dehydrogenase (short-subunit alcohol dehydrogenase family)
MARIFITGSTEGLGRAAATLAGILSNARCNARRLAGRKN